MNRRCICMDYSRRVTLMLLVLSIVFAVSACGPFSKMPFNGEIEFHSISLVIPEEYIRDSTQSTDDLWLFERGLYRQHIILSRKDANGDTPADLGSYVDYMKENGAASEITTFIGLDSVFSAYTMDGVFCQEMLFIYDDAYYAIALRGGDEKEFNALLDTVAIGQETTTE